MIYFFSLFSAAAIGAGLVMSAWLAVTTHSLALAGQLFLVGSLATLAVSLVGGPLSDGPRRARLVPAGQALRLAAALALVLAATAERWLVTGLFTYSALNAVGLALAAGALDAAVLQTVEAPHRVRAILRLSLLRQFGLALGTAFAGIALERWSAGAVAAGLAAGSGGLLLLALALARLLPAGPERPARPVWTQWAQGLAHIRGNPRLCAALVAVPLCFSVAQMSNLVLPAFVHERLAAGSEVYGALESLWTGGGMGFLLLSAWLGRRLNARPVGALGLLALLGLLMLLFSATRSPASAGAVFLLLGGVFALTRALMDATIAVEADINVIGRVRALTSLLTSLLGLAIYAVPSVVPTGAVLPLYRGWGVVLVVLGGGPAVKAARSKPT